MLPILVVTCYEAVRLYDVIKVKIKVKVHTPDIAAVRSESPLQKRSGMALARVLKGFHSFICPTARLSAIGMSHTCLCLPSYS